MSKQQWKAGDLVEVTVHENLGWGDKCQSYLVLVLGRHYAKQKQTYPLTAELERARNSVPRPQEGWCKWWIVPDGFV